MTGGQSLNYSIVPEDTYLLMSVGQMRADGKPMEKTFGNSANYNFHRTKQTEKYKTYEDEMVKGCYRTCESSIGPTKDECEANCRTTWIRSTTGITFTSGYLDGVDIVI